MKIRYNGSKWLGEEPDSLDALLDLLKVEPLDPRFAPFASNVRTDEGPGVLFHGNFFRVSNAFAIEFDISGGPEYDALLAAVRENMLSRGYLDALMALEPASAEGGGRREEA